MQLKNHLYTIVETDKQENLQQKEGEKLKEAAGLQQNEACELKKEATGLQQKIQNLLLSRSNTSFRLRLNPEHFIYQAHFPGEPVTPGVCILQIGKELLAELLQESLEISHVKNVKFLSVISPLKEKEISYTFKKIETSEDSQEVKAQIIVASDEETKAKISFTCRNK